MWKKHIKEYKVEHDSEKCQLKVLISKTIQMEHKNMVHKKKERKKKERKANMRKLRERNVKKHMTII